MKRIIYILSALFLVSCAAKTPEKVIEKYTDSLREGKYEASLWNLEKFAKLYYADYWDKAEEADRKKMLSIIEKNSQGFAKVNQGNVQKAEIKSMKRVEEKDNSVKLAVLYVRKNDLNISLELTFLLEKEGKNWKIVNIEKIAAPLGGTVDPLNNFKVTLPILMKDLGCTEKELNLKLINKYFEEKFINQSQGK